MGKVAGRRGLLAVLSVVLALPAAAVHAEPVRAQEEAAEPTVAADFQDRVAIGSITEPTAVAFAPDGTAFVALKTGVIKSFDYSATSGVFEPNATSTDFADLSGPVMNYWDRGLTGIAVDPQFPTRPYVYVNYTYNRDPRDDPAVVPKWGDQSGAYDDCPTPASFDPPAIGCPAMARVTRLTAERKAGSPGWTMVPGREEELLAAGCFQFPSHASGDVRIGPDGLLYASFGDGASFTTEDWGQVGNPCGDPADEGGSLRAQDARTTGDPLGVDGSIVRMDPDKGLGTTPIAEAQVAYGQRNPWRFSFRDGTSELWSSDVGGSNAEEVNKITVAPGMTAVDRGWPCYEGATGGSVRNSAWEALDKPVCKQLYAAGPAAVQPPVFSYSHDAAALPGAACQATTSATSGVAFAPTSGSYPAGWKGALYFGDFARGCLWRLGTTGGQPDPSSVTPFVTGAGAPVALTVGPGGDLYYVDYGLDQEGTPTENAGAVHRVEYRPANRAPVARPAASGTSGPANPLTVTFDGSGSADPDGGTLSYAWDLDGDGAYDDATGRTVQRSYTAPTGVWVSLRVTDPTGLVDQRTIYVRIAPGNAPPAITSMTPADGALWGVGDRIAFAAAASDESALPESAFRWQISMRHCPGGGTDCHTHPLEQLSGRTASMIAPDHEWVSYLLVKLTVTDAAGLSTSRTVQLAPLPSVVHVASRPAGVPLTVAGSVRTPPYAQTFISGSAFQVAAPERPLVAGVTWLFDGWSDGGARTHSVTAGAQSLTAAYRPEHPEQVRAPLRVVTSVRGLVVRVDRRERRAPWSRVYSWGSRVRVVAPRRQWRHGVEYRFVRWGDGGPRRRVVVTREVALRLRAVYRRVR